MKKLIEKATVEAFLKFGGIADASLLEWDRERPDAVICLGTERVGIEITKLSEAVPRQSIAPQKWKAESERIVESARLAFESQSSEALVVRFEMAPDWNPPARNVAAKVAEDLASVVRTALSAPRPFSRVDEPITSRKPHPAVEWLYIGKTRQELGGHWRAAFAHDVRPASSDDLRVTVARKEHEIAAYRMSVPKVWLLIDCDLAGQGVALDVPTPGFTLSTEFERVFGCGFAMWQWVEITTNRLSAG